MLEHDLRVRLLAEHVPDRLAERLRPLEPSLPLGCVPGRRDAPVIERLPVHVAHGAEGGAVLALVLGGHDRHRPAAGVGHQLDRERAEAAGAAPHEHDVAGLDDVRLPPEEHPVGGAARECRRGCLLPRQVIGLRHALVVLDLRELGHRSPAGVVAPDAEARGQPRVASRAHPRVLRIPLPRVHGDRIADRDVAHRRPDRVDDAAGVGPDDVEVGRLAPSRLGLRHIDRHTSCSPYVIEVHARGHRRDEHVVGAELRHVDHLVPDRVRRVTEAVGSHDHRVHPRRHLTSRRQRSDVVEILGHGGPLSGSAAVAEP